MKDPKSMWYKKESYNRKFNNQSEVELELRNASMDEFFEFLKDSLLSDAFTLERHPLEGRYVITIDAHKIPLEDIGDINARLSWFQNID